MKVIETLKVSCLVALALALSTVDLAANILTLRFLRNYEDEEADTEVGGGMG